MLTPRLCRALGFLFLCTVAALSAGAALAAEEPAEDDAGGEVLADSGFRPDPDGFRFANWGGNDHPGSDQTGDDLARLLGDEVCARFENDACVPTPAARMWIEQMNRSSQGGHCAGMAALSAAFYIQTESVADFGGEQTHALEPDDLSLLRTISAYFSMQALEPVSTAVSTTRGWSLQQIVDQLIADLKERKDYPTIGISFEDGGHAVTPYRVVATGPGQYRIDIYDNNYPGAEKSIDIDTENDLWSYAGAALNPSEVAQPWSGGHGTMALLPLDVELECPFCGDQAGPQRPADEALNHAPGHGSGTARGPRAPHAARKTSENYSIETPSRCSQLRVVGKKDHKTLQMGPKGVENQIAGASMWPRLGVRGCQIVLPRDQEYDVQLIDDGRPARQAETQLTVFGAGRVYSMDHVAVHPKATETWSVGPKEVKYQAGSRQTPTLRVAEDGAGSDGYYEVSGFSISQGHDFTAEEGADGKMAFGDDDDDLDTYDIKAEAVGAKWTKSYSFQDVKPGDKGEAVLDIESDGDLELAIDSDSDGQVDAVDTDDDNDGIPDVKDTDENGDGVVDGPPPAAGAESVDAAPYGNGAALDTDHDGVPDATDSDDDNDGTPDVQDSDENGNGEADSLETAEAGHHDDAATLDTDHDGIPDVTDRDDDNDGVPDVQDSDENGDGVPDPGEPPPPPVAPLPVYAPGTAAAFVSMR